MNEELKNFKSLDIPAHVIDELTQYYEIRNFADLFKIGVNLLKTCHNMKRDGYDLFFLKVNRDKLPTIDLKDEKPNVFVFNDLPRLFEMLKKGPVEIDANKLKKT